MQKIEKQVADHLKAIVKFIQPHLSHQIADCADVDLFWSDKSDANRVLPSVMGYYTPFKRNRVVLAGFGKHSPELMVPTLCHELRHKWQFDTWGWFSWFTRALLRNQLIEPTAYEVEDEAELYYAEHISKWLSAKRDAGQPVNAPS